MRIFGILLCLSFTTLLVAEEPKSIRPKITDLKGLRQNTSLMFEKLGRHSVLTDILPVLIINDQKPKEPALDVLEAVNNVVVLIDELNTAGLIDNTKFERIWIDSKRQYLHGPDAGGYLLIGTAVSKADLIKFFAELPTKEATLAAQDELRNILLEFQKKTGIEMVAGFSTTTALANELLKELDSLFSGLPESTSKVLGIADKIILGSRNEFSSVGVQGNSDPSRHELEIDAHGSRLSMRDLLLEVSDKPVNIKQRELNRAVAKFSLETGITLNLSDSYPAVYRLELLSELSELTLPRLKGEKRFLWVSLGASVPAEDISVAGEISLRASSLERTVEAIGRAPEDRREFERREMDLEAFRSRVEERLNKFHSDKIQIKIATNCLTFSGAEVALFELQSAYDKGFRLKDGITYEITDFDLQSSYNRRRSPKHAYLDSRIAKVVEHAELWAAPKEQP